MQTPVHLFDQKADVLRQVVTQDLEGGPIRNFTTVYAQVICRARVIDGQTVVIADKETVLYGAVFHFEPSVLVQEGDKIVHSSGEYRAKHGTIQADFQGVMTKIFAERWVQ